MGDGVTFSMPPLEEPMEITGPSALKLFVSSSTSDADLFVVLRVFDRQGAEVCFRVRSIRRRRSGRAGCAPRIAGSIAELSLPYRPYHSHDELQQLRPGEAVELDIEIWPTCIVVPAGYRIALSVRGRDYEHEGEAATLSNMKNPMKGCGPFVHDDPTDRPPEIFGGKVTLHFDRKPFLLLPVIPES